MIQNKIQELRVSSDDKSISGEQRKKNVKKLAGAISHALRESGEVNVRCFGNASIAKASKAMAISQSYIKENGIFLSFSPAFINADFEGFARTGIGFFVFATDNLEFNPDEIKDVLLVKGDEENNSIDEKNDSVKKLAGAISHYVGENGECFIRCFGNAAVGKASRALAMARGFVAQKGGDMYCASTFIKAEIGGNEITGIGFYAYSNNG